jgi:GNAT superfamily N-acetyltransferase
MYRQSTSPYPENQSLLLRVEKIEFVDPLFSKFAALSVQEWPCDFFDDFATFNHSLTAVVGLDGDKVVAGCFVSHSIVCPPIDNPQQTALVQDYYDQGFLHISYFVVDSAFRGNGLGAIFLEKLYQLYASSSFWLSCEHHLASFYTRNGFVCASDAEDLILVKPALVEAIRE